VFGPGNTCGKLQPESQVLAHRYLLVPFNFSVYIYKKSKNSTNLAEKSFFFNKYIFPGKGRMLYSLEESSLNISYLCSSRIRCIIVAAKLLCNSNYIY